MDEARRQVLESFLSVAAGASSVSVANLRLLSGGAIQENWAADISFADGPWQGPLAAVIRTDSPSGVRLSLGRAQEFALFRAAFAAGVTVPEPLWLCEDEGVIGKPFFIMRRVGGIAAGHKLVKDDGAGGGRQHLARQLGCELARIHSIRPPRPDLAFLPEVHGAPALARIAQFRHYLDQHDLPRPAIEYGLRWLELRAPPRSIIVLCHNDYRTGNYMVDANGVTGILDWEFAGWGDPHEDIGWFCARCWRFGAIGREAGGIGARDDFYAGYEAEADARIDRPGVLFWEVMATIRWAMIAIQQAERHTSGSEPSLELALTGHIVPELEQQILEMIATRVRQQA